MCRVAKLKVAPTARIVGPILPLWDILSDGTMISFCPSRRVMELQGQRDRAITLYALTECTAVGGKGITLTKAVGRGTDAEADGYTVFVSDCGRRDSCECRGWLRHGGSCRHILACRKLVGAGWLAMGNPMTEMPETVGCPF
ncbi:SWIM zinc finger family protein [Fimbriiglobus ruber]|uniref:SWIM-type domain-containing protein n=1 Tax=Fimbriiglobus ruber TaxID=1908690 RepID=A0A225CYJ9_9BACT|nr:SWIM zinc finger family protein [Fimbriiglobus ruber]OWK34312.1 hypothetical protein FRUB_10283 [Fimbriiglobus ruber]